MARVDPAAVGPDSGTAAAPPRAAAVLACSAASRAARGRPAAHGRPAARSAVDRVSARRRAQPAHAPPYADRRPRRRRTAVHAPSGSRAIGAAGSHARRVVRRPSRCSRWLACEDAQVPGAGRRAPPACPSNPPGTTPARRGCSGPWRSDDHGHRTQVTGRGAGAPPCDEPSTADDELPRISLGYSARTSRRSRPWCTPSRRARSRRRAGLGVGLGLRVARAGGLVLRVGVRLGAVPLVALLLRVVALVGLRLELLVPDLLPVGGHGVADLGACRRDGHQAAPDQDPHEEGNEGPSNRST